MRKQTKFFVNVALLVLTLTVLSSVSNTNAQPCTLFLTSVSPGATFVPVNTTDEFGNIINPLVGNAEGSTFISFDKSNSNLELGVYTQMTVEPITIGLAGKFLETNSSFTTAGNIDFSISSISKEYKELAKPQQEILHLFFEGKGAIILSEKNGFRTLGYKNKKPILGKPHRQLVQAHLPNQKLPMLTDELALKPFVNSRWSDESKPEKQLATRIHEYEKNAIIEFVAPGRPKKLIVYPKKKLGKKGWPKVNMMAGDLFNQKSNVLVVGNNFEHVKTLGNLFKDTFFIPTSRKGFSKTLSNQKLLAEMEGLNPDNTAVAIGLPATGSEYENVFPDKKSNIRTIDGWKKLHGKYKSSTEDNKYQEIWKNRFLTKAQQVKFAMNNPNKNTILIVCHSSGSEIIFEDGSKIAQKEFTKLANASFRQKKLVILFSCYGKKFLQDYKGPQIAPYVKILAGHQEALTLYRKLLETAKTKRNMFDLLKETFKGTRFYGPWTKNMGKELDFMWASNYYKRR